MHRAPNEQGMNTASDHTTGAGRPRLGGRRRTVARLAAVQALYQLELNPALAAEAVIREFANYRLGQEIEGDQLAEADPAFFADIVRGVAADQERLDADISVALVDDWPLPRLELGAARNPARRRLGIAASARRAGPRVN